jgi:hypothetical protein
VVRPGRRGAGGAEHGGDDATVKVRAIIGEVLPPRKPNGDVVGFVAFEHDAKPFEEWRGRQDLGHCFAAAVLLTIGQ